MSEVFKHVGPHMHPSMASWAFFSSPHGLLPPFSLPFLPKYIHQTAELERFVMSF